MGYLSRKTLTLGKITTYSGQDFFRKVSQYDSVHKNIVTPMVHLDQAKLGITRAREVQKESHVTSFITIHCPNEIEIYLTLCYSIFGLFGTICTFRRECDQYLNRCFNSNIFWYSIKKIDSGASLAFLLLTHLFSFRIQAGLEKTVSKVLIVQIHSSHFKM